MAYGILCILVLLLVSQVYFFYRRKDLEEPMSLVLVRSLLLLSLSAWFVLYVLLGYAGSIRF